MAQRSFFENTWRSADNSPPFAPIAQGGLELAPDEEVTILDASEVEEESGLPARVKVVLHHRGASSAVDATEEEKAADRAAARANGNLEIGLGLAAGVDLGEYRRPYGTWVEFYSGAVTVKNTHPVAILISWVEYGTL